MPSHFSSSRPQRVLGVRQPPVRSSTSTLGISARHAAGMKVKHVKIRSKSSSRRVRVGSS